MTHKEMYMKLMIEYNKQNEAQPLTEYDAAVALDKAYNAVIALKITGNNVRRAVFESDIKAISDLYPLIKHYVANMSDQPDIAPNVKKTATPSDMLYFLNATGEVTVNSTKGPMDKQTARKLEFDLVPHETAKRFFSSAYNMPWIKKPVCFIENDTIYVAYDIVSKHEMKSTIDILYIKKPNTFVKDLQQINSLVNGITEMSYFSYSATNTEQLEKLYTFECNDTVAEEVISLAISFLLENTESNRLNSKLNMRGLEA